MANDLTMRKLKNDSFIEYYKIFFAIYKILLIEQEMTPGEIRKALSMVVLFSNQSDSIMQKLGYRMALAYGLKTNDFLPLYDISINTGLIPIVALIRGIATLPMNSGARFNDSFISNIVGSYIENFNNHSMIFTEQQLRLSRFFHDNLTGSATIIAPTSYGKSELIISALEKTEGKITCVLVPSKALLAQTKKRILNAKIGWISKIVSHPEMHTPGDDRCVYILTQERLTRILNEDKAMSFDIVVIDEAHNLLSKDDRNTLLASVMKILEYRNTKTAFKFLTPFLKSQSSLALKKSKIVAKEFVISEYVKSEILFLADYSSTSNTLELYDHFTNEFIEVSNDCDDAIAYIKSRSADKNLLYFNRPKHIQEFAKKMADRLPVIGLDGISEALKEITASTHERYLLLYCIKHGVIYHHGSMNDSLRNYVEHLFRNCSEIKFLLSNSTLLEGVNLPIEKMFLLSTSKGMGNLRRSQFKNLIGRINRFSEIFTSPDISSLRKLQPEVHIVATADYIRRGADLKGFCSDVMKMDKKEVDVVENVLLEETVITDMNRESYERALTRLSNLEPNIDEGYLGPRVLTEVGRRLYENNINEINIFESEKHIQQILDSFIAKSGLINDSNSLMLVVYAAFVSFINEDSRAGSNSLIRLRSDKAQTFYAMFLDWNVENVPLTVMIGRFIRYWDNLPSDTPVFVGGWGMSKRMAATVSPIRL